jgi:hypothetical protein
MGFKQGEGRGEEAEGDLAEARILILQIALIGYRLKVKPGINLFPHLDLSAKLLPAFFA